jgi:hypothetical protein
MWQQVPLVTPPSMVLIIVGAPRSGTSHLFNLLAGTGMFAYLTTASCWAWPVRNVGQFNACQAAKTSVDVSRRASIRELLQINSAKVRGNARQCSTL